MSNERLGKLRDISTTIALVFVMIIKGKVGFAGGIVATAIAMVTGVICIKKGIDRKPDIIEGVFVSGGLVITFTMGYLFEFTKIDSKPLIITIIAVFIIWLYGGFLILYIRKRRRERK